MLLTAASSLKNLWSIIFLGTIFSYMVSCKINKNYQAGHLDFTKKNNNLVFLTFKIFRDSTKNTHVILTNKVRATGTIKKDRYTEQKQTDNTLILRFLNRDNNFIKDLFVENPLFANLEHFTPEGLIARKEVELEEATFSIRTEISDEIRYIKITNKNHKTIGIIDLE